jgi:hypothetical protein
VCNFLSLSLAFFLLKHWLKSSTQSRYIQAQIHNFQLNIFHSFLFFACNRNLLFHFCCDQVCGRFEIKEQRPFTAKRKTEKNDKKTGFSCLCETRARVCVCRCVECVSVLVRWCSYGGLVSRPRWGSPRRQRTRSRKRSLCFALTENSTNQSGCR